MKISRLLSCIAVITLLSCGTNSKPVNTILSTKNIKSQYFFIDPEKDTTLIGSRGGYFKIEKGSFDGEGRVKIEIKEIYSPSEIIYAGLTTESNGQLLESGGMIYFNATRKGKKADLQKLVDISIPASYINKEMQLFKGEEKEDGSVNWVDPESLDTSLTPAIDTGEIIFNSKCANCHTIFKDGTGPALAGVEDRVNDRNVLKAFIRNPAATMAENFYFQCQKYKFGSMMTAFPDLGDHGVELLLDYIKNETARRPDLKQDQSPQLPKQFVVADSTDYSSCIPAPCGFDTIYIDTADYDFGPGANFMDPHEEATRADSLDALYKDPDSLEIVQRSGGITDLQFTEGRYNFKIKTLGWFNVDAFYKGMKGTSIVDLFVSTDFEQRKQLEVHVFFPAKKILTVGTLHDEDSLFHFEKYKGQIPLFLNDEAVAFAVTSMNEKIYYGITAFRVRKQQTILLEIKETTKEKLKEAFINMKLDGIDLDLITKKRLIVPKNCNGTTADTILNSK